MSGSPRPAPPAGGRPAPRPGPRLTRVDEVSAGGLVVDRSGPRPRAALIARHDRRGRLVWSLPKGHVEAGETPEDAAVREVEEETGIRGSVLAPLGTIDFWFVAEQRRVHKTVHHYLLAAEEAWAVGLTVLCWSIIPVAAAEEADVDDFVECMSIVQIWKYELAVR